MTLALGALFRLLGVPLFQCNIRVLNTRAGHRRRALDAAARNAIRDGESRGNRRRDDNLRDSVPVAWLRASLGTVFAPAAFPPGYKRMA
ncbi:hypothetical protein DENSPDRAFT_830971 [Dentipellis sp. KUC8613]|nr:hypothetical protein DENSPDRAFT_830971 [Dentipellis sp. KUC8613]